MVAGVYVIRNTVSGSEYVGSAVNIDSRWNAHRHTLRHRKKSPPKLQRAWDKYGEQAFEFSVLLECNKAMTLYYEQRAIDVLKPKYNTRSEAKSNLGIKWSAETNAKKASKDTQMYEVDGIIGSLPALAKHFGNVGSVGARARIKKGMTVADAVKTPCADRKLMGNKLAERNKLTGAPSARIETVNGVTASIKKLVEMFATVNSRAVYTRLQRGWSVEKAVLTPLVPVEEKRKPVIASIDRWNAKVATVNGVTGSVTSLATHFGVVSPDTAHKRMSKGWDVVTAVTTPARRWVHGN